MIKRFTITAVVLLVAALMLGQGNLIIYGWSDYIPDEVIEVFSQEYGIRVTYDTYDSNETMFAKLKAGARGYDLAMPSADYTSIMIKEEMLLTIDKSLVPNLANIDPNVIEKMYYDPNNNFSIPYMVGTTGIAVNTKYIKSYPRSWKIFELPQLQGKMTMLDDMREVFGAALKYLGYSVNTTDVNELQEAKNLILNWKRNIAKIPCLAQMAEMVRELVHNTITSYVLADVDAAENCRLLEDRIDSLYRRYFDHLVNMIKNIHKHLLNLIVNDCLTRRMVNIVEIRTAGKNTGRSTALQSGFGCRIETDF